MKKEASEPMKAVRALRNLKILIVDDDKDTREMLRFVLEQEGGQVTAASTVGEALEEYKRLEPNVVVVDIGMTGANGYRARNAARSGHQSLGAQQHRVSLPFRQDRFVGLGCLATRLWGLP
jgi:CheY-like chemotaxis protein